jgi:hypothetical protein
MRQAATALLITAPALASGDIRMGTDFQPLPFEPAKTLTGDADGDGLADLFFFHDGPHTVSVYFGREDARFEPGPTHPLPANPVSVARIADLNADGRDDLVVVDRFQQDAVFIFPAGAGGAYGPHTLIPTVEQPRMVAVTDTDADGRPDLVVSNGTDASIHRNLGDLLFGPPAAFSTTGGPPIDVIALDIHANASPELAFLLSGSVLMYRNGPDGYTLAGERSLASPAIAMAANDTVATVGTDLLIAHTTHTGVSVLTTNGSLNYVLRTYNPNTIRSLSVTSAAFGDITGNGRFDVLHGWESLAPLSPVYRTNSSAGLFRESEPPLALLRDLQHAHLADLDSDGRSDLVLVGTEPPGLLAITQPPEGTFRTSAQVLPTLRPFRWLTPIPGEVDPPAFLASEGQNRPLYRIVFEPAPVGLQIAQTELPGTIAESASDWQLIDVDADTRPDLVRRVGEALRWQLAGPDGSFGIALERGLGPLATGIATADFNADGTADFAWIDTGGQARIAYGRASGFISPPYPLGLSGFENAAVIATADFDADGLPDLTFTDRTADGARLHVALNQGNAVFGPPTTVPTIARMNGLTPTRIAIGDFTRDGRRDVVVAGADSIALHPADPAATILDAQIIPIGPGILDVTSIDLDADRRPELVVNLGNHAEIRRSTPGSPLSERSTYYSAPLLDLAFRNIEADGLPSLVGLSEESITVVRNLSTPACVPDFDSDGTLDFFDVAAFLSAFQASDPAADLTDDAAFDFFDIARFFGLFSKGCP